MIKIGINGFGRIGRFAFRSAVARENVQVVGINDLLDVDYLAYMLKYDSVHGPFQGTVEVADGKLIVNGNEIRITAERNPADLKWGEIGADYIIGELKRWSKEAGDKYEPCEALLKLQEQQTNIY